MVADQVLVADWPAPGNVRALATTRLGGVSHAPWHGWNLGDHVGDRPDHVAENRRLLVQRLGLPDMPSWLRQVHGKRVVRADQWRPGIEADACVTDRPGVVCAVMSADCLPVLFCSRDGHQVAAAHAGWRGLAAGVLEATVVAMGANQEILAWLGPAIGAHAYEVGDEVRRAFVEQSEQAAECFRPSRPGHWWLDLYGLARLRLAAVGVTHVGGGDACTHTDSERFFSFRRDGQTGRMASLIWRED